ncbi:MAG: hypothetical protein CMI54_04225 [Parcubacteria group bacterium]|nr:hypothetical protein [Parcubacteria group bacterium]|tara:strand:+ start:628 stop:2010 length:1383 start_codon:yes stop_codon:yes gene_type:complete
MRPLKESLEKLPKLSKDLTPSLKNGGEIIRYDIFRPWLTLDDWQKKYIEQEGNCFILCGRQSGKSAAMSIKFGKRAATRKNRIVLMLAFTEKQAYALFFKTLEYLEAVYPRMIDKRTGYKPTKHVINLRNGSKIMCYAAGLTGEGIRGYTVTDLVIDEAAAMSREVFVAVSPMLSVTGGTMDLSSTPKGKEGYFYEASLRDDFEHFYVSAEDCPRHTKQYLDNEKKHMSKLEYAQEYLAIFLDDLKRVFSDELLDRVSVYSRSSPIQNNSYYLGVDCARLGGDETTYIIIDGTNKDKFKQTESIAKTGTLVTQIADEIIELDKVWKFKKIGIDDAGVGAGVFDILLKDSPVKHKVIGLSNAKRALDRTDKSFVKALKEDMYLNLLTMLENNKLKLLRDSDLIASLKNIQYEYVVTEGKKTRFRIFGNNTHIAEGLIRAAWLLKSKSLKLWVASKSYGISA